MQEVLISLVAIISILIFLFASALNIFGGFEEVNGFFGMQEIGFAVASGES